MEIEEAIIEIKDASDSEVRYGDTKHHHDEVIKRVEAFDMAIKALEEISRLPENLHREREQAYMNGYADGKSTCRWISVDDKLPEPNRLVLCYITTGASKTYFLAFWNANQNAWEEGIGGSRLLKNDLGYEVIAWMPLPKPYKREAEA